MGLLFQNDEGITFVSDEIQQHCLVVLFGPVGLHISANVHCEDEFTVL